MTYREIHESVSQNIARDQDSWNSMSLFDQQIFQLWSILVVLSHLRTLKWIIHSTTNGIDLDFPTGTVRHAFCYAFLILWVHMVRGKVSIFHH